MDLSKLLESINNPESFTVVTQKLRARSAKLNIQLNSATVDALTKIRSLETNYFSTFHDKGAAYLALELLLQLPPSNTWRLMEKTLAQHLAYWLDNVRHLIDHDVQWWSFVKPILNYIRLLQVKTKGPSDTLVAECAALLLEIATNEETSAEQAHQILTTLNFCVKESSRTIRYDLAKNLKEFFLKLSRLMASCGHFPLQSSALQCYVMFLINREESLVRVTAAKTWLPRTLYKEDVISIFHLRTFRAFSKDSREFLNALNASNDRVISVQFDALMSGTDVMTDTSKFWLDLNGGTRCLTTSFCERTGNISQWNHLTVTCDNVTNVTLSRVLSELTVTITTKAPPVKIPSPFVCPANNLEFRLVQGCSVLKIDKGLRIVFGDKYQVHPDMALEIDRMKLYQRHKRSGIMMGNISRESYSLSSASTTSLAQLPERLAALIPQGFDKKTRPVQGVPGVSPVIELSDDEIPDSFESATTRVISPKPNGRMSFKQQLALRQSQSDESSTPRPKIVYVENTQSDHDSRTHNTFVRLVRDPRISAMANSNNSRRRHSQAADIPNQWGLESERVPDNNAMFRINSDVVELLLQEALGAHSQGNDSGVITGHEHGDDVVPDTIETLDTTKVTVSKNVKSPVVPCKKAQNSTAHDWNVNLEKVTKQKNPEANKSPVKECSVMVENMPQDVIDKLTNSGDEVSNKRVSQGQKKVAPKRSVTKITNKSSTSDESNTSAISNTPMTYVNVRKRNLRAQPPAQTINEDDEESHEAQAVEDFFTSHYNDLACDKISPTRARQINETSSDSSDDLEACLISNQDLNVNVEQFNLDVDVMECVTNLVDKVCELEKSAQDMAQELSARNAEKSVAAEACEVDDPEPIKNIEKTKKGRRGRQRKCAKKPTKPALKIKFKSAKDKDVKTVKASKMDKLVLEPVVPTTETDFRGTTDTSAENNTNNKSTPRIPQKRKLYSPKDDHKIHDGIHSDDSDDQPLILIRENSVNQKKNQTKRLPPITPPSATCYIDIANDRKKNTSRPRRFSKSLSRKPECISPRTKKKNEVFDSLKTNIDNTDENITLIDKKSGKDFVYNFPSDSDDEDFEKKKIESPLKSTRRGRAPKKDKNEGKGVAKNDKNKGKNPRSASEKTKAATKKPNKPAISCTSNIERGVLEGERMRNAPQEDLNTSLIIENPQQNKPNEELVPKINPPVLEVEDDETINTKNNNKKPAKKRDLIKSDVIEHAKTPQSERGRSSTPTLKSGPLKTPKLDIPGGDTEGSVSSLPGLVVETVETESHLWRDADDSVISSNLMQKVTKIFQNQNADNGNDTTQNLLLDEDEGSSSSFHFEELLIGKKNNATNVINSESGQENGKKLKRYSDISDADDGNLEKITDDNGTQLTSSTTKKKSLTLKKASPQNREIPIVTLTRLTIDEIRQHSPKHRQLDEIICLDDEAIPFPVIECNYGLKPKKSVECASNKNIKAVREKDSSVEQIERECDVESGKSIATVDLTSDDETPPQLQELTEQFELLKRHSKAFSEIFNKIHTSDENDNIVETPKTRRTTNKDTPKKRRTTDKNTEITPKKMQRDEIRSPNSEEDLLALNYPSSPRDSDSEVDSDSINHTNTKRTVNVTTRPKNVVFVDESDSETSLVSSGKIKQWLRPKKRTNKEVDNNNRRSVVSPIIDLTDSDQESSNDEVRKPTHHKVTPRNSESSIESNKKCQSIQKPRLNIGETSKIDGNKNIEKTKTMKSPPFRKDVIKKSIQIPPGSRPEITSSKIVRPASSSVGSRVSPTSVGTSKAVFPQKTQIPSTTFINEVTITPIKIINDEPMSPVSRGIIKDMLALPGIRCIPPKGQVIQVNVPSKIILHKKNAPQTVKTPESSIETARNIIKSPVISESIRSPVNQYQNSSTMAKGNVETPQTFIRRPIIRNTPEMATKIAKGSVQTPHSLIKRPNTDITSETVTKQSNKPIKVKTSINEPTSSVKRPTGIKPPMKRPVLPSESEVNPKRRKDLTQPDGSQSSSLRSVDEWLQNWEQVGIQDVAIREYLVKLWAAIEEHVNASIAEHNERSLRDRARFYEQKQNLYSELITHSQEKSKETAQKVLQEFRKQISRLLADQAKWVEEKMAEMAVRDKQLNEEHIRDERAKIKTLQKEMKEYIRALLFDCRP